MDWEMAYNAIGIRTKQISKKKTYSRTAYTMLCKVVIHHTSPGIFGFRGFFTKFTSNFINRFYLNMYKM